MFFFNVIAKTSRDSHGEWLFMSYRQFINVSRNVKFFFSHLHGLEVILGGRGFFFKYVQKGT